MATLSNVFSFESAAAQIPLRKPVTFKGGDVISTTCIYNSTVRRICAAEKVANLAQEQRAQNSSERQCPWLRTGDFDFSYPLLVANLTPSFYLHTPGGLRRRGAT